MIHQKKNRGHRTSKIVISRKSYSNGHFICSFYYLARALMHDVACEFACAEGCAETISANVLKELHMRNYGLLLFTLLNIVCHRLGTFCVAIYYFDVRFSFYPCHLE